MGASPMYCSNCGKPILAGARFCSSCGAVYTPYGAPSAGVNFDGLVRPKAGRTIAGVCAGLARRYGWDVNMVRVVWLLAVVLFGTGVLVYVILWIAIPEESYVLPGQPTNTP